MDKQETIPNGYYASVCDELALLLHLSFSEVRNKYTNYPICLMEYIEKEVHQKTIEIRFDSKEFTITCEFDSNEKCNSIYLLPDKREALDGFIHYLKESYDYDFIKARWNILNYHIHVNDFSEYPDDIYLVFTIKSEQ